MNKGGPGSAARARATDRKRGGLYYYNVGRWARQSIDGANEGSVIITHDLTPALQIQVYNFTRLELVVTFYVFVCV